MKHLFYTTSESAWEGLTRAIARAEKSIYIEMYIFIDDSEETKAIINLLAEKAYGGVHVHIILDAFGSFGLSRQAVRTLRDAGVELLFFKKFFRRLHRKIVVVDQKLGFIGGVNIHGSAKKWSDLLIRVDGPVVRSLVWSFRKIYKSLGGKNSEIVGYQRKALLGRTRLWLLEHVPFIRKPRLRDSYIEAILKAEKSVLLVTPYFLPHRWMRQLLEGTVARGVEVTVLVPKSTDISFLDTANRRYMTLLEAKGVKFFLQPKMNHAKLLLVDEALALVGSQNIDALSFDFNAEAGLFFTDVKMIAGLKKITEKWKAVSVPFDPLTHISFSHKVLSFLIKILQPFL